MDWVKNVLVALLSLVIFVNCEWVEISQGGGSQRKFNIKSSMVSTGSLMEKDLNKLSYEQLAEIIGPEFEVEFSKFLTKHSHEIGANGGELGIGNQTMEEDMFYVDPWMKYDLVHTTAPFLTSSSSKPFWMDSVHKNTSDDVVSTTTSTTVAPNMTATTTVMARPNTTEQTSTVTNVGATGIVPETDKKILTPAQNVSATKVSNSTSKPKLIRKIKRIQQLPYDPFHFNEVLSFWRRIQNTFSMDTARGITAKIQILTKFKDDLLHNIRECYTGSATDSSLSNFKKFRIHRAIRGKTENALAVPGRKKETDKTTCAKTRYDGWRRPWYGFPIR